MKTRRLLIMILSVAISSASAFAQDSVSLSGEVKGEKGQAMPGVLVSAKHAGKTVTVVTKFDGKFTITDLVPGSYDLKAIREGFATVQQRVDLPQTGAVGLTLKPGPIDRSRLSWSDMEKALPEGPYKAGFVSCQICHSWNGLASQRPHRTQDWIAGMNRMVKLGFGRIEPTEIPKMAEYLQAHFGPDTTWAAPIFPGADRRTGTEHQVHVVRYSDLPSGMPA